ncbi:MAG: hypothetical protein WCS72_16340 [Deltaproteobacteria bacterium]
MKVIHHTFALVAAAALTAVASPAQACSVCGCGDPLVGVGQVAGPAGQFGLELDGQYLYQKAGGEDPGTLDILNQWSLLFTASYTPVKNLNLVVTLPWVWKGMQMEMEDGTRMTSSNLNGFGDMQVGARWFFWEDVDLGNRTRQTLSVSASTFIPTGNNSAVDADGIRIDEHGQIGTGGWGPNAGLFYRFQGDLWSAYAGVWGLYRTTNSYGYRFGAAAMWTAVGQYQPLEWLALSLGLDGRYAGYDQQDGVNVENTGGMVLAVVPAVYARIFPGGWLLAKAQLPIATSLNGIQTIGPVVTAGLRYEFE